MKKQPSTSDSIPLAIGTGLVALDVVISNSHPDAPRHWAGGTCGNVLTILRYLGWRAAPVARLRGGEAAKLLLADLKRWGVSDQFISLAADGSTPLIVQRITLTPAGDPYHTFSWRCPNCGARLPGYKPVLATEAEELGERLITSRVFFFDRLSRGALVLARRCADLGAAVVFEPSSVGNPSLFREAWKLADVVKYSHERLHELPFELEATSGPRLQIETLGRDGLRYRTRLPASRSRTWQHLEAIPATRVRDSAGAGDWCTAGVIHRLFPEGASGIESVGDAGVRDAIRYGQALAAWTCGFEGARGGMYETAKAQFERDIAALLGETAGGMTDANSRRSKLRNGVVCVCPSCGQPEQLAIRPRKARLGNPVAHEGILADLGVQI